MTKKRKPSVAGDIIQGLRNAAAFLDGKPVRARVHVPDRTVRSKMKLKVS